MKNEKKSKNSFFTFTFFCIGKLIFCQKTYLVYTVTFALPFFHVAGYCKCSNINVNISIYWLCRCHTLIQNTWQQLGILTTIWIAMDYFFYLQISVKFLQFRKEKYINLGNQFHYRKCNEKDRNISKTFVFIFHHSIQHKASGYSFYKEKEHLLGNIFGSPYTSNRIYLLRNYFSNYVYLKDMYITSKSIGKILFVSVLRILQICKFLNFTALLHYKN